MHNYTGIKYQLQGQNTELVYFAIKKINWRKKGLILKNMSKKITHKNTKLMEKKVSIGIRTYNPPCINQTL
jgi:hypothetical protein